MAFTEWPKIQSQSQIFKYGQSIFCLPHKPNFSDNFNLCLHWVSIVRGHAYEPISLMQTVLGDKYLKVPYYLDI